ncbi:MAG: hypothetical protein E7638_07270 [Ruminococcaceae bacterium]|nr:hypothetical protein [Oscillospiraceae bacterium]
MKKGIFMKKGFCLRFTAILLMICLTLGLALTVSAAYPNHTNYVYDGAGILSSSLIETIKSTNDSLYGKVKARISVCVVESLGDEAINEYADSIFREWNPGEGVLLLVTTGEDDYYAMQSVRVARVLDNEQLDAILKEFMEPDFAEGNAARGIQKTVNKLSGFMKTELPAADMEDGDENGETDGEKVTFGGVILSILKIIGWTVLILVVAFAAFFVAALFNDTAAELMQKYVFSYFTGNRNTVNRNDYYDERLYGRPQTNVRQDGQQRRGQNTNVHNRQPGQRSPQQRQVYDRYRQGGVRYDDEYYGRQSANRQQNPNRQNGSRQGGQAGVQSGSGRQQNTYNDDYGYTRQFTINDSNRRGGNY